MLDNIAYAVAPMSPDLLWLLAVSFLIAFLLAFSVGANDVSNSFGTSVGSRVLTVTQACILATFFEVAGATLLGYSVCDTFRVKIYDVKLYTGLEKELMVGALSCLIGSAMWNIVATAFKMPISGTHSIIGATIGFSLVLRGWSSIQWPLIGRIVASWFASPLISGAISSVIYILVSKTVIRKIDPLKNGLKALPFFYGATVLINVGSVVINGPAVFGLDQLTLLGGVLISVIAAGVAVTVVALYVVPRLRRAILDELALRASNKKQAKSKIMTTNLSPPTKASTGVDNVAFKPDEDGKGKGGYEQQAKERAQMTELTLDATRLAQGDEQQQQPGKPPIAPKPSHLQLKRQHAHDQLEEVDLGEPAAAKGKQQFAARAKDVERGSAGNGDSIEMLCGERFEIFRLFSTLQIMTACFASFAHGSNDVSNAVAPLIPIWNIYSTGKEDIQVQTPIWILAFGGIGICTGLWAWGRAVMATVGEGLTKLTPTKGFSIELGAAISVLLASKMGLPISTTHCKVGSVVIVGLVSSKFLSQDNLLNMNSEERAKQEAEGAVDWKLFGNIAITWVVTVPLAAVASALVTLLLKWLIL